MISIIIPTYNEQDYIASLLTSILEDIGEDVEVIVVDGGSTDRTVEIVKGYENVKLAQSEKGRAVQMNNGARMSKGEVLFFVHADSKLPELWKEKISQAIHNRRYIAGTFYLKFDITGFWYGLYSRLSRERGLLFTYGDQGLFVERGVYDQIGGYPTLPIMEDYEILNRLKKVGKITKLDAPIITSSRKFSKNGVVLQQLKNIMIVFLYKIGTKPERLARWYNK